MIQTGISCDHAIEMLVKTIPVRIAFRLESPRNVLVSRKINRIIDSK